MVVVTFSSHLSLSRPASLFPCCRPSPPFASFPPPFHLSQACSCIVGHHLSTFTSLTLSFHHALPVTTFPSLTHSLSLSLCIPHQSPSLSKPKWGSKSKTPRIQMNSTKATRNVTRRVTNYNQNSLNPGGRRNKDKTLTYFIKCINAKVLF